jgi:hypothetical protein
MSDEVTLRAIKDIPGISARLVGTGYQTRRLKAGDDFIVSSKMAKLLKAIKKAEDLRAPGRVSAPPARVVEQARSSAPAEDDFLDRSIPAVAKDLSGLDSADIRKHLSAEKRGKGRKGLITAFEAELEARKA